MVDRALVGEGGRPRGQARRLRPGRPAGRAGDRGAHLPPPLRRGLVDGDPLDRAWSSRTCWPRSACRRARGSWPSRPPCSPRRCPACSGEVLDFPYVEGLRLDEAMHPLAILATGLYGEPLPKQNGAPIRLVVPWKYGFKSIKSIVRISPRGGAAAGDLEPDEPERVRLLLQREPRGGPPALVARRPSGGSAGASSRRARRR